MKTEQQHEDLFLEMVTDITARYADRIKTMVAEKGGRPSFDELRDKVLEMEKELIDRAVKIIEIEKKQGGSRAEELTGRFKTIIDNTLQDFIKTL